MKFDGIPSFSKNSWPKQNFNDIYMNFRGMYCFERLKLLVTYSLMVIMWLEISSKNSLQLFILSKRFGWMCGLVLLYEKLPWNFPLWFETSARCCLQPWQHSVYQLCRCVWDHLRTLLMVVIVAKVSNYSTKKSRSSTSRTSTQLKYWKRWNAKGY